MGTRKTMEGGGVVKKVVWQNSVKGMRTCIDLQIFTSTNVNLNNQLHRLYTLLQINHFYLQYVVKDYSSIMLPENEIGENIFITMYYLCLINKKKELLKVQ